MKIKVKAIIIDMFDNEETVEITNNDIKEIAEFAANKNNEIFLSGVFGQIKTVKEFVLNFSIGNQNFEFKLAPSKGFSVLTDFDGVKEELCSFEIS